MKNKILMLKQMLQILLCIVIVGSVSSCAQYKSMSNSKLIDPMLIELQRIHGEFVWDKNKKRYDYLEKIRIESIVAGIRQEQVIKNLVACIDNSTLSESVINGKRVRLGVVCYQALSQTAYYELTSLNGDVSFRWAGHISPSVSLDKSKEAKKAWEEVLKSKSYLLL